MSSSRGFAARASREEIGLTAADRQYQNGLDAEEADREDKEKYGQTAARRLPIIIIPTTTLANNKNRTWSRPARLLRSVDTRNATQWLYPIPALGKLG